MRIGTLTTGSGVVSTFNLNYVPEIIEWDAATAAVSGISVNILDLGIVTDLDAQGIKDLGGLDLVMKPSATNFAKLPIGDGVMYGKTVEVRITNGGAQTPDIFVRSRNKGGKGYMTNMRQKAYASTPIDIQKFALLGLGNAGANDLIDITYQDGTVQTLAVAELPRELAKYTSFYYGGQVIYNRHGEIKNVRFTPAADQLIYIQRAVFNL